MFILDQKLKLLKNMLNIWNKTIFGNVNDKAPEARKNLKSIHSEIERLGYSDTL